jgi:DNA-binding beta-propeller fold protein YncE
MKRLATTFAWVLSLSCQWACSEPTVTITVDLSSSTQGTLDPFSELSMIRVSIDGPDRFDDAIADLPPTQRETVFEGFPADRTARLQVKGFDAQGILRAYGRRDELVIESEDLTTAIPFRKLLAYVTHASICDGVCPDMEACVNTGSGYSCFPTSDQCGACGENSSCVESLRAPRCLSHYAGGNRGPNQVYVIDVNTREVIERLALPTSGAKARSISMSDGDSVLVSYEDGNKAFVGVLSQADHSWRNIEFKQPVERVLLGSSGLGVAAGSGSIVFFELETGKVLTQSEQAVAGKIVDGVVGDGGRKAVVIMSRSPGALLIDFERREIIPPGEIIGASGVGISEDGRVAYITSSNSKSVTALDLRTGGLTPLTGEFTGVPGVSSYSETVSGLLSIYADEDKDISRVIGYSVAGRRAFETGSEVGVLPNPMGIAAAPGGRRVIVVSAGTSTETAGLTVIDPDLATGLDGSTISYPLDPDDSFTTAQGQIGYQRYRPSGVAITYGR